MNRRDVLLSAAALAGCAGGGVGFSEPRRPMIIAHRGASGDRPEHTMASYRLAIEQGADFIEPDLVLTKDFHLVCRHENELSATTDVSERPEFAARRAAKAIDGDPIEGWFAEDFTLAELKTLRCRERIPQLRPGNIAFNDQESIPTFQEVFELARDESSRRGRLIGLVPELKHPTHFQHQGMLIADALRNFLVANDLNRLAAPVFIQCFEETALRALRLQGVQCRLVFLMSVEGGPYDQVVARRPRAYADYLAADPMEIREFADAVGLEKTILIPRDESGASLPPTDIVARLKIARLGVLVWTFRAENAFLPAELRRGDPAATPDYLRLHGDLAAELRAFARLGIDGVFTDHPGLALGAFQPAAA